MFNWCQSVSVYSFQKHYHYYSDRDPNPFPDKHQPDDTSTTANRNSKPSNGRGLSLLKELDTSEVLSEGYKKGQYKE
jgi:hypothetical protein